jgi:hypothetical protein
MTFPESAPDPENKNGMEDSMPFSVIETIQRWRWGRPRGASVFWFGLIDRDGAAADLGAVQLGDGLLGLTIDRHFNETKPLGLTGIAVDDDIDLVYLPKLAEHGCQFVGRHPVRQITYVNLHAIHSRFKVPYLCIHRPGVRAQPPCRTSHGIMPWHFQLRIPSP